MNCCVYSIKASMVMMFTYSLFISMAGFLTAKHAISIFSYDSETDLQKHKNSLH